MRNAYATDAIAAWSAQTCKSVIYAGLVHHKHMMTGLEANLGKDHAFVHAAAL